MATPAEHPPLRTCTKSLKRKEGWLALALLFAGCSINSAKKHYVLAENLWNDGKYGAAVAEFEKAAAKDPNGKLGQQALYRAASTQALFLSQYASAIRKLKQFSETTKDAELAWDAKKQIGELYFNKLEQYDQAIPHYQALIQEKPSAPEVPEFLFRIARSRFFLGQFDEAILAYKDLNTRFPDSSMGERAAFEVGVSFFTRGAQNASSRAGGMDSYQEAMGAYRQFITRYPRSEYVPQAKFGIASCLEELDQLDAAYQMYSEIRDTYPSRNVILIKLARIRERKSHRSH